MTVDLCKKCHTMLAISPDGLCNICDEQALQKRKAQVTIIGTITTDYELARLLATHRNGGIIIPMGAQSNKPEDKK